MCTIVRRWSFWTASPGLGQYRSRFAVVPVFTNPSRPVPRPTARPIRRYLPRWTWKTEAVKLYHARAYFSPSGLPPLFILKPSRTNTRLPSPNLSPPHSPLSHIYSLFLGFSYAAAVVFASLIYKCIYMYILVHYNMPNGCWREESFKNKAAVRIVRRGCEAERRKLLLLLLLLCVCHCRRHLYYIIQ